MPGAFGYAVDFARRIRRLRDRWVGEQHAKRSFPCRRGCDLCCHQPVGTLIVEGVLIAFHTDIYEPIPKGGLRRGEPCPFLRDAECSIYQYRPISCSTLFPAETPCSDTTKNVDNRPPVHAARELDIAYCRRIGFLWPGPLFLTAAVRVGRALLAGVKQPHLEPEDCCITEERAARLRGAA